MKKAMFLMAIGLIGRAGLADGVVPDCFNLPGVVTAQYIITINATIAAETAKDDVYSMANTGDLTATRPYFFDSLHIWMTTATLVFPSEVKEDAEAARRFASERQPEIELQLLPVSKMSGVTIACSPARRPATF